MQVVVVGAGVVGVTAAWYLAEAGHEVTVVDRQADSGLETSFANGGQISAGHAEPWANPSVPGRLLKWLGREDAPLLFRLRADPQQWAWGLRFLVECMPRRARANTREILALALYSREELRRLRRETGIEYDAVSKGILHFFTDPRDFERGKTHAAEMYALGCEQHVKSAAECRAIEPALASAELDIAGGVYTPGDESGDAHRFTQELARRAQAKGVRFLFGRTVNRLEVEGGRVARIALRSTDGRGESLRTEACVVALGAFSRALLHPLGIDIPVYPLKGYSITAPVAAGELAPTVSLTDDAAKLVLSRLGDRLRVAGTAEMSGYSTEVNRVRCEAIVRRTRSLFPRLSGLDRAEFWAGLRPATPSNIPLIGRARYDNLYLDTGHGTLGWTLACGSGRALADMISGRRPEPKFGFLGLDRAL